MLSGKSKKIIRKAHRYLGLFIGIQFLMWTISGLYFSWTNIDEIHGDQFKNKEVKIKAFDHLIRPAQLQPAVSIHSIELREIEDLPFYWINKTVLYNAKNGLVKNGITKQEALNVAKKYMAKEMVVKNIQLITEVDKKHEYREKLLPAYVISYEHQKNVKAYISANDGAFQTVRHRDWRWFDFLWMTHTMDYDGRDNINTFLLRAFSLLGLLTVLSGFLLWFSSSPTVRRIWNKNKNIKSND